ncbi:hypothetical protein BH10CYA1_BH10CYA1_53580 [soil metagenome]
MFSVQLEINCHHKRLQLQRTLHYELAQAQNPPNRTDLNLKRQLCSLPATRVRS